MSFLNEGWFRKWVHDDITWCTEECSNTDCERNTVNRLSEDNIYAAALFKGTDICPLTRESDKHD